MPAWRSLAVIARCQPLTAKELAKLTSSDAFKVARAIELLVRCGLIRRDVDAEDRRRASLSLTAKGHKIYKDIEKFGTRVERELSAALDQTELKVLREILNKFDRQLESRIRPRAWELSPGLSPANATDRLSLDSELTDLDGRCSGVPSTRA